MTVAPLRFRKVAPREWGGRYRRVPGDTKVFHVRRIDGEWLPVVEWERAEGTGTCRMVDGPYVEFLAQAVNDGKAAQGAPPGGAFLIDEYGRVLVPARDGAAASVFVVGECTGSLRFHDPFSPGAVIDLYADDGLRVGDPWDRPYLGMRYQLSARNEIYHWNEDEAGAAKVVPPAQDPMMIASLRTVRPYGAVRFLVGPGGIVLTKLPPAWEPTYVGRLDLRTWFPKEQL
jgi:hypothetical protein